MNKLWAGRTEAETAKLADDFNSSIAFDSRMAKQDITGSMAHAAMLGAKGIITAQEAEALIDGLQTILDDLKTGALRIDPAAEDIHMFVEQVLTERIGDVGKKLHTARSRNDQVALDFRMYLRGEIDEISALTAQLASVICDKAEEYRDAIMPGYTHLQRAQPISFGHQLMAYAMMLLRDLDRLKDCRRRLNVSPIGCCALAGTTYDTDREMEAEALGFDESQGVRNVKKVYREWKGWISWNSRETYKSRPQNHSSSMSWFTSTYSTDLDAREFALTNGAIWTAMSGSATCYRCPNHTRVLKGSNPNWSYVMNAFFGWDYSLGSDAVAVNDPRLLREYVTRADRRLLFAEIPFASYTGDTPNTDSGSGTACDCVLQYKGTGPNPESIGFNHKSGRDITAHVVFADGHAEKLLYKEKQDVQELTRWLCEAKDVAYNASSGRYEELR